MESCDKHDDCIVCYETKGYHNTKCPMCKLVEEAGQSVGLIVALEEKLEAANEYADELADELAQYNQPIPAAPDTEGRHFRV